MKTKSSNNKTNTDRSPKQAIRAFVVRSRTNMFGYMVQIAQGLPKGITLTENDIEDFVKYAVNSGGASKLDWLEKNQDKYQYFG